MLPAGVRGRKGQRCLNLPVYLVSWRRTLGPASDASCFYYTLSLDRVGKRGRSLSLRLALQAGTGPMWGAGGLSCQHLEPLWEVEATDSPSWCSLQPGNQGRAAGVVPWLFLSPHSDNTIPI